MKIKLTITALTLCLAYSVTAQEVPRDQFFWLGEMNKATAVINSDEGLLDKSVRHKVAQGIQAVIDKGNAKGGPRPAQVIRFEPLLIQEAGMDVTMLHIGRSSQDMHATYESAIARDNALKLSEKLTSVMATMLALAKAQEKTVVPNYTNGVAAQPNSYAHYLMGYLASFERDQQKIREYYARLNRCPMGTTVLNGTSWPLNRERMANYLGFDGPVLNAYDAAQMKSVDGPVEMAGIVTSIALRVGSFVEDVLVQYAQPRPWILLEEGGGNTYVSSAMPQKRNPGLLNSTRVTASETIGAAHTVILLAHNIPPGMSDPKSVKTSSAMVDGAVEALDKLERILKALRIDPQRALEELNNDWTASQEVADVFMREYKLPFRVGHHVASGIVGYAKANNIRPSEFPYSEVKRIYAEVIAKEYPQGPAECPMPESLFLQTLDPVAIVANRRTAGGPQGAELQKAFKRFDTAVGQQQKWSKQKKDEIDKALKKLDRDFAKLLQTS